MNSMKANKENRNLPMSGQRPPGIVQALELLRAGLSKAWNFSGAHLPMPGIWAALMLAALPLRAESELTAFEGLVGQLTELRLQQSRAEHAWQEQQPQLEREAELLRRERELLKQELAGYRSEQSTLAEERAALLERRDGLQAALRNLNSPLRRAELGLHELQAQIPAALLGEHARAFDELPADDAAAAAQGVGARLQRVLALYSHVQKLQHDISVTRELIALDGGRREMDVIYLGLCAAYAVSGGSAALGSPAEGGWNWRAADELAAAIAKAVAIYRREQPAALLALPLSAERTGGADE
jgi:hypothetical protein